MPADLEPAALLRAAALRVTAPRLAVLAQVHKHPHADAAGIASAVREQLGSVSTQAVYDVLRALTQAGLVRQVEPAGSPARFEPCRGDNHHHLVCRSCRTISDIPCVVGAAPCLQAVTPHGFVLDEAEVTFWGICADCLARGRLEGQDAV